MEDDVIDDGPPKVTEPEPVPDPPHHDPPADNTRELIAELSGKVDALAATVSSILTHDTGDDTSPVKPPWTHRKLF